MNTDIDADASNISNSYRWEIQDRVLIGVNLDPNSHEIEPNFADGLMSITLNIASKEDAIRRSKQNGSVAKVNENYYLAWLPDETIVDIERIFDEDWHNNEWRLAADLPTPDGEFRMDYITLADAKRTARGIIAQYRFGIMPESGDQYNHSGSGSGSGSYFDVDDESELFKSMPENPQP